MKPAIRQFASSFLCLATLILGVVFYQISWLETLAFICFSGVFIWNIHAYLNDKNMTNPPKMHLDVSACGDKGARKFLFGLSITAYVALGVGWLWKFFTQY